jgi:hypothetical protein
MKSLNQTLTLLAAALLAGYTALGQESLKSDDLVFKSKEKDGAITVSTQLVFKGQALELNTFINTEFSEFRPATSPSGNRLYFSRAFSPDNTGRTKDPEDIFYTEYNEAEDSWSQAIRLPGTLNTTGRTSINQVSVSGDTLIYASEVVRHKKNMPLISYSVNEDGAWSAPIEIPVPDFYNLAKTADTYVSIKTGVIIASLKRNDTFGDRDLYVCFWDGQKVSPLVNMGHGLNTDQDESSPFLSADQKTIYFASKGHAGYGGYDIFSSTRLDDSWTNWTKPENLGTLVNTAVDEEYFMITQTNDVAMFARLVGDKNYDLFRLSLEENQKTVNFR